jgi:site-specific DNA-methyltransferase (adenine-specific)
MILAGDCIEQMRTLEADSVDAIVTDPPYGLEFMGKEWDGFGTPLGFQTWSEQWAREALRVLKPGGHLLAFGGTRMYHRLASGIEDAGFEIRDTLMWLYGSGFPKSLDVSKAIDKVNGQTGRPFKFTGWMRTTGLTARQINEATQTQMGSHYLTHPTQPAIPTPEIWATLRPLCADVPAWVDELVARIAAEREVTGVRDVPIGHAFAGEVYGNTSDSKEVNITAPSTAAAKKWQGWGTALKPAVEPIVLARKPLIGTVAENVLTHGTGALNIDASRIRYLSERERAEVNARTGPNSRYRPQTGGGVTGAMSALGERHTDDVTSPLGRWPANILLDEEAAAMLDDQSGVSKDGVAVMRNGKVAKNTVYGGGIGSYPVGTPDLGHGGAGGASRFFYVAKASRSERNAGLERNIHPTVKPVALMKYLIRLVVPKGGVVLDPFLGSGTTAVAAIEEGVEWIGCEREPEYLEIIEARVAAAQPGMGLTLD